MMKNNSFNLFILIRSYLFLVALLIFPSIAQAVVIDGIEYTKTENGEYSVTGYEGNIKDVKFLSFIQEGNIKVPVTSISQNAFHNCKTIEKITIPSSIMEIWDGAFCYTLALHEVIIEDSDKPLNYVGCFSYGSCVWKLYLGRNLNNVYGYSDGMFSESHGLKELVISENVTEIGDNAFFWCSSLEKVVLPKSITHIGMWAFGYCEKLSSIMLQEGLKTIDRSAFYNCSSLKEISIPSTVTNIGDYTFSGCKNLSLVQLPENLSSISTGLFEECESLVNIEIPHNVTSIGKEAFAGCSLLPRLDIPSSVTVLGTQLFKGCRELSNINIPTSVTSIEDEVFMDCIGLKEIVLPSNITNLGHGCFKNCTSLSKVFIPQTLDAIKYETFSGCTGLSEITIPASIVSLGHRLFKGCSGIKKVTFEDGNKAIEVGCNKLCKNQETGEGLLIDCPVEELYIGRNMTYLDYDESEYTKIQGQIPANYGYSAFCGLDNLAKVHISETVTSLQDYTFKDCKGLKSIIIPNSVKKVGDAVFEGCDSLSDIYFSACNIENFSNMGQQPSVLFTYVVSDSNSFDSLDSYNNIDDLRNVVVRYNQQDYAIVKSPQCLTFSDCIYNGDNARIVSLGKEINVHGKTSYTTYKGLNISYYLQTDEGYWFSPTKEIANNVFTELDFNLLAPEEAKQITLSSPGTLINELGINNIEKIVALKITGQFDGTDVLAINRMKSLKYLDLGEATIVSGGPAYYMDYKTVTNWITPYLFSQVKLKRLILPTNAINIQHDAFAGCEELNDLTFSNLIGLMVDNAVKDYCPNLHNLTFLDKADKHDYDITVNLYDNFHSCPIENLYVGFIYYSSNSYASTFPNLKILKIGNLVDEIPDNCFRNSENLEIMTMGDNLQKIGNGSFYNCSKLPEIIIPASVTSVGHSAFAECKSAKEIIIEDSPNILKFEYHDDSPIFPTDSIVEIYYGRDIQMKNPETLFSGMPRLKEIIISDIVTDIPDGVFQNNRSLELLTIGKSVKKIGRYAFSDCSSAKSLILDNSLETIGERAFKNWELIESLSLPLSIKEIYEGAFENCNGLKKIFIPKNVTVCDGFIQCKSLKEVILEDGIKMTGRYSGCTNLEKINLPSSVKMISEYAFQNCSNLNIPTLPKSLEVISRCAFESCQNLREIIIPNSVQCIFYRAFKDCRNLEKVTLSNNISAISEEMFYNCNNLTSIMLPINVTDIYKRAFFGCEKADFSLPNNINKIGDEAFYNSGLINVVIPESVHELGIKAFSNSKLMEECQILCKIEEIPTSCFSECSSLHKCDLPSSIKVLNEDAFNGCSSLDAIHIPSSVDKIKNRAFLGCSNLTEMTIEDSPKKIEFGVNEAKSPVGKNLMSDCPLTTVYLGREINYVDYKTYHQYNEEPGYFGYGIFYEKSSLKSFKTGDLISKIDDEMLCRCVNLTSVELGSQVTSIGKSAFRECVKLSSINTPESLTKIDNYGFSYCSSLESYELSPKTTELGTYAFAYCTNLKKVSLPHVLKTIPDNLFQDCKNLSSHIDIPTVEVIGQKAFYNCSNLSEVTFGKDLTTINSFAFSGTAIKTIRLPKNVTKIDNNAFSNINGLEAIYTSNPTPPTINTSTFDAETYSSVPLNVVSGAVGRYWLAQGWGSFTNIKDDFIAFDPIPDAIYGDGVINLNDYSPYGWYCSYQSSDTDIIEIKNNYMYIRGAGDASIAAIVSNENMPSEVFGQIRNFTVNKAMLSVKVDDLTINQSDPVPDFTYRLGGLKYQDKIDDIQCLPTPVHEVTAQSEPGRYVVTLSGGYDKNYDFKTSESYIIVLESSSVDTILRDNEDSDVLVFNMNGILIYNGTQQDCNLNPGIYIVRSGNKSYKILVK